MDNTKAFLPPPLTMLPSEPTYAIMKSAPSVAADEVETTRDAIEITILWGRSVLAVEHLDAGRSFSIGEPDESGPTDFLLDPDALKSPRVTLVDASGEQPVLTIPRGANCALKVDGAWVSQGEVSVDAERRVALPSTEARIEFGGFSISVRRVAEAKRIGVGAAAMAANMTIEPFVSFLAVGGVVGILLLLLSLTPPGASALSTDLDGGNLRLVRYLIEPSEIILEPVPETPGGSGPSGTPSEAAEGEAGEAGDRESPRTNGRVAIRGDHPQRVAQREEPRDQSPRDWGVLGSFASMGSWNAPNSPYGAEHALGPDDETYNGALTGLEPGENFGFNGLGPHGRGRGGGGDGAGTVGVGRLTGICDGDPASCGNGDGPGNGRWGRNPTGRFDRDPNVPDSVDTIGSTSTSGLPREVIQRVIGRHRNEVRYCYEQALVSQPDLAGRVTVSFVIGPTGTVSAATPVAARSDLASPRVQSCVAEAVRRWSFPQPDGGGVVSVTYPFLFTAR